MKRTLENLKFVPVSEVEKIRRYYYNWSKILPQIPEGKALIFENTTIKLRNAIKSFLSYHRKRNEFLEFTSNSVKESNGLKVFIFRKSEVEK